MIDMAFAKKRVDDRKLWLLALEPGSDVLACALQCSNYNQSRITTVSHSCYSLLSPATVTAQESISTIM
jgi:hypothetical protein